MFHPLQNRSFFLTFNCRIAAFWPSWDTTNARWFLDFPQNHSQDLTILLKSLAALSQFLSASLSLSQPLSASLNPLSTLSQPLSGSLGDYRPHNHHQSPRAVSEARRVRHYVQGTPSFSFVLTFVVASSLLSLSHFFVSPSLSLFLSLDEEVYAWTCTSVFQ